MNWLKNNWMLVIGILILIALRIPSLFEPHWYVDEGMHATIANNIHQGATVYRDIYDHKPQLLFYVYGLLGNDDILLKIKVVNIGLAVVSLLGIYQLTKKHFDKTTASIAFLIGTGLIATPLFEGNVANGENFFMPLVIGAVYFALSGPKSSKVLSGLLFGLAFLIKFHPLLELLALLWFLTNDNFRANRKLKLLFKDPLLILMGFALPVLLSFLLEALRGNLSEYIQAAYINAFFYSGDTAMHLDPMWTILRSTVFKIGLASISILFMTLLFWKNKIGRWEFLITIILIMELFGVYLSGRPYEHYWLQAVLGISIVSAFLLMRAIRAKDLFSRFTIAAVFLIMPVLGLNYFESTLFLPELDLKNQLRIDEYYQNFWQHAASGTLDSDKYEGFFGSAPSKLKELKVVKQIPHNYVYVYTDMGWTYSYLDELSPTRIFVAFQLFYRTGNQDEIELVRELEDKQVDLIVTDRARPEFDELQSLLDSEYSYLQSTDNFDFYILKNAQ